jgi:hypothetical protein
MDASATPHHDPADDDPARSDRNHAHSPPRRPHRPCNGLRALVAGVRGRWRFITGGGLPMRTASRNAVPATEGSPREPADSLDDSDVEERTE